MTKNHPKQITLDEKTCWNSEQFHTDKTSSSKQHASSVIDLAAKWKMNGHVTSICLKGHVTLRSVFLDDNDNNQKSNKQKLIQTNPHSIHVWYIYKHLPYKLTLHVLVGKNIPSHAWYGSHGSLVSEKIHAIFAPKFFQISPPFGLDSFVPWTASWRGVSTTWDGWHSPYILVYKDSLLTYLLVSVPSILTLRFEDVRTGSW